MNFNRRSAYFIYQEGFKRIKAKPAVTEVIIDNIIIQVTFDGLSLEKTQSKIVDACITMYNAGYDKAAHDALKDNK